MYINFYNEVKNLTKELVKIPSIVREDNGGESRVAKYIYNFYNNLEYFNNHPEYLIYQKTINDEIDRHNCIAMVKGTKGNSNKTIILMGHIDTVGIDDYHEIKDYATDPDILPEKLRELNISDEINKDIESGEYMFGRGALDMKSGVAGHMAILKYFAENPDKLEGNLIALAECDEEDNSHGVISALKVFEKWKKEYDLDYIAAINADYSTPHHKDDMNRYIYFGTIGKLLPSFYVTGSESHVGHPYSGFDPNILIAELTKNINLNTDLTDYAQGERTMPPVSLKQTDTKKGYTVQTALSAYAYYNFFTHKMNPKEVIDKMKTIGEVSFENVIDYYNRSYEKFCNMVGEEFIKLPWEKKVFTWGEYVDRLEEKHGSIFVENIKKFAEKLNEKNKDMDLREFSIKIIQEAWENWEYDKKPTMIIFLGSVYSAPIELSDEIEEEKKLIDAVNKSIDKIKHKSDRPIVSKYFYPYISDSSFMSIDKNLDSLKALEENMPSWGTKYIHPIKEILEIDVPVVNIGTFGYDGHSIGERVHMKHTFDIIPNISLNTILNLLSDH